MIKRIVTITIVLVLVMSLIPSIPMMTAQARDVRVTIDGSHVVFPDQQPVIVDGRTLVPVRGVFEALGFDVTWDSVTSAAILERLDYRIVIPIGSPTFSTNGRSHSLDVPAQLMNNRTMLPLRFPLESVGYELDWDSSTWTVIISTRRQYAEAWQIEPGLEPTHEDDKVQEVAQEAAQELPDGIEIFHYVYRSDVVVINHPPPYGLRIDNDIITITVPVADDAIRNLQADQVFVLEDTLQNPDATAGRVISVEHDGAGVVITAAIPETLEEVFYEFELVGTIDVLASAGDIIIPEEFDGAEIIRNTTDFVEFRTPVVTIGDVSFSGSARLYHPVLQVDISMLRPAQPTLILTAAAEKALRVDVIFASVGAYYRLTLFTIPIKYKGIKIDIPFSINIHADGIVSIDVGARFDARFGVEQGRFVGDASFTPHLEFDLNASANLCKYRSKSIHI